jgi:hypothetical protein
MRSRGAQLGEVPSDEIGNEDMLALEDWREDEDGRNWRVGRWRGAAAHKQDRYKG